MTIEFTPEEEAMLYGETPPEQTPETVVDPNPAESTPVVETAKSESESESEPKIEEISDTEPEPKVVEPEIPPKAIGLDTEPEPTPTVNLDALHAERERRKASDARSKELEAKLTKAIDALRKVGVREPDESLPDFEEEPARNLNQRLTVMERQALEQDERNQTWLQEQQVTQQLNQAYDRNIEEYMKTTPDFKDARDFYLDQLTAYMKTVGYNPQQISKNLMQEERNIVAQALSSKINPAYVIYQAAKQLGYSAKPVSNTVNNGKEATANSIETVKKGLAASSSTPSATGDKLSNSNLLNVPIDEFEELFDEWVDRLAGGN